MEGIPKMRVHMLLSTIAVLMFGQTAVARDTTVPAGTAPAAAATVSSPVATVPAPQSAQPTDSAALPASSSSTPSPQPAESPATSPPVSASQPVARQGLAPTVTADGCELHIWPAERMQSQSTGWLGGFGMIGAVLDQAASAKANSARQSLIASALDSNGQLDALLTLDLRTSLSRTPGTTLVVHETAPVRNSINKIKTRRSESTALCYSELIVADVLFQKNAILGRSLKTLFMFRDFGNDQKIDKEYKAWGGNGVKLFPPKEGEDAVAALDELVKIYKQNFDEYARNARTALAQKTR
jgi:hypothetical protein